MDAVFVRREEGVIDNGGRCIKTYTRLTNVLVTTKDGLILAILKLQEDIRMAIDEVVPKVVAANVDVIALEGEKKNNGNQAGISEHILLGIKV